MEAIKQIVRIPENHEIRIKVPQYVPKDEIMEVILIVEKRPDSFKEKIRKLKEAVRDDLFLDDFREISEDFKKIDLERWVQEDGV